MILTRRAFLSTCAATSLLSVPILRGRPYPGITYRNYARCLPDFFSQEVERYYQRRNERVSRFASSPDLIEARQKNLREAFWRLIGGQPEVTPLNTRITGSFERPGYRVENVVYESRPNFHIPANLYIPTNGTPPYPGVLFQMGHSLNGKAAAPYQRCCQGLAQLGFVVLGFDPMGQGERAYYPREDGYMTRLDSVDEEHSKPGRQMLLLGDTSTRLQLWDAVRSIDFLAEHPLVDPNRLASTGQSGGATLTMMLVAVDDRIQTAALSCGNTENYLCADFNPPGSTDDAEQNLLWSATAGFDRWDMLYPFAPKPLLIMVSARDWFGTYSSRYLSSGWEEFEKLESVYEALGSKDRIKWIDTALPHNLSYDFRLEIYRWMLEWLGGKAEAPSEEPPTRVEDDRTLWVTTSGSVVREYGGETPFSLNLKNLVDLDVGFPGAPHLMRQMSIYPPRTQDPQPEFTRLGSNRSGSIRIEAVEVQSAPKVWVPAWLFLPSAPAKNLVVIVEPFGRSVRWREDDLYQTLAAAGTAVCAPDLRWIGDLRPEYSEGARNHAHWHQDEEAWTWGSLILGSSLLGQRVTDLLAVLSAVHQYPQTRDLRITLAARDHVTVPALVAAAMSPLVDTALLNSGLVSYRSIVETEEYSHPFGNFVTGILRHTDLPGIAAGVSPRRLILAGMVDGAGRKLPVERVREIYGESEGLEVTEEQRWDVESLQSL